MGFFSVLFGSPSKAQPPEQKSEDVGKSLRLMMLTIPAAQAGEKPTAEFPRVYGVLMDWPIDERTATILATSSGAASLYTTSRFGIIGGEGHETVRAAAKDFVRAADRYCGEAVPTKEFPYPAANRVRFYFLTFDGVRVIEADLDGIEKGRSKFAELFGLGQEVLTRLRVVTEKKE